MTNTDSQEDAKYLHCERYQGVESVLASSKANRNSVEEEDKVCSVDQG
jgi:hypothetical protein